MSDPHPLQKLIEEKGIAAREATDSDSSFDVLQLGTDFWYLKVDGDRLGRTGEVGPHTPTRIILDPEVFSRMLFEREHPEQRDGKTVGWILGITPTGTPIQIHQPAAGSPARK